MATLSRGLSRAALGFEVPGIWKGAWIWRGSMRLCWTRRIPNAALAKVVTRAEEKVTVEGESHGLLQRSRMTGRVPGLDYGMKGSKVEKANLQPERSFRRRAVLGEEYQVASENTSSLSQPTRNAHVDETSTGAQEGDVGTRGDQEIRYDETVDSSSSSHGLSTSGNSDVSNVVNTQQWFPYDDSFKLNDENTLSSSEVLSMLSPFLVDGRKQRIEEVVAHRTYSVCIVVEGLLDLGNISAVFRSADALGFQSVHVIGNETKKKYKKNRKVSMGTEKWLDAEMWDNAKECIATLRKRGYRIAVTHIAPDTVSIHDMDWTIPTAVFFGNEHKGVSEEAIVASDIRCSIPMAGMVDSFNVSVAAGILMHHAAHDRIARSGVHGDISPEDRKVLEAEFCLRHNRQTVQILDRLVEKKENPNEVASLRDMFDEEFISEIEEPEYLKI